MSHGHGNGCCNRPLEPWAAGGVPLQSWNDPTIVDPGTTSAKRCYPPALVCQVGSTTLKYHVQAIEDCLTKP